MPLFSGYHPGEIFSGDTTGICRSEVYSGPSQAVKMHLFFENSYWLSVAIMSQKASNHFLKELLHRYLTRFWIRLCLQFSLKITVQILLLSLLLIRWHLPWTKTKGKSTGEDTFYIGMGNPERMQCSVCFILKWRSEYNFSKPENNLHKTV